MSAECFPVEIWLRILSELDYKDLVRCSYVNKTLYDLCAYDSLWMEHCKNHWIEYSCPTHVSWKEHFINLYRDLGTYIKYYRPLKNAWNQLMDLMKTNCPSIFYSVKPGASEAELDAVEEKINFKLPLDLRCSYRIHNGQKLVSSGLMGNVFVSNHYRSALLLDIDTASEGLQTRRLKGCMPLTLCVHSGFCEFISLSDENGFNHGSVFSPTQNNFGHHLFIAGENFMSWFTNYVSSLVRGSYTLKDGCVLRFYHEPDCNAKTGSIEVLVSTCFVPELSTIKPPCFLHAYQITMQMDKDASKNDSCKLESRHWIIVDENGDEERVDGSGVVGEYPVMRPGETFTWISCTTFKTTYGSMKGYFTMRNLMTGEQIDIDCPTFHMKCLPYMTLCSRSDQNVNSDLE